MFGDLHGDEYRGSVFFRHFIARYEGLLDGSLEDLRDSLCERGGGLKTEKYPKPQEEFMTSKSDPFAASDTLRHKKLIFRVGIENIISDVGDLKPSVFQIVSLNTEGKPMFL
jgi:hypothetical protein